jgi:hypothetical protein
MSSQPLDLAKRIRVLAEKRASQARTAADANMRKRLNETAANYQALADAVARQNELPSLK